MHAGCPEARPAYVLGSRVKEVLFKAKRQWLRSSIVVFFFLISQTGLARQTLYHRAKSPTPTVAIQTRACL